MLPELRRKLHMMNERQWLLLITAMAIPVYVVAQLLFSTYGILDDRNNDYHEAVVCLLEHGSFETPYGRIFTRTPPLFPLMLAALYKLSDSLHIPRVVLTSTFSITITLCNALWVYKITSLFTQSKKHRLLAYGMFVFFPFIIYATYKPLSLVPFSFFLYGSLFFFFRGLVKDNLVKNMIWASIFLGLSLLIRPIGILLPVVYIMLVSYFFFIGKRIPRNNMVAMLLVIPCFTFLTIAPWTIHNYIKTDRVVLLSSHGLATLRDGFSFNNKKWKEQIPLPEEVSYISDTFFSKRDEMKTTGQVFDFILEEFKKDPWNVIVFYAYKAKRVWYGLDSQNSKKEAVILPLSLSVIVLMLAGMYRSLSLSVELRFLSIALLVLTLYFWSMSLMVVPLLRYMIPVYGLFFIVIPVVFVKRPLGK